MLAALLAGERDPDVLADLARGRLRAKLPELRRALTGRIQPHHLVLIDQILQHIDFLEGAIAQVQVEIERCLPRFEEALDLVQSIPGIRAVAAAAIVAEIGIDMSRFPTAGHLASWAGVCPTNKESAGKRMTGPMNRGNVWLRSILGEVAWASIKTRTSYFSAQFLGLPADADATRPRWRLHTACSSSFTTSSGTDSRTPNSAPTILIILTPRESNATTCAVSSS
jgi:transposase